MEKHFTVVTCADANMLPAACCALLSVRKNLAGPARFLLIAVDPDNATAQAVQRFNTRHDIGIEILPFDSDRLPPVDKGRWNKTAVTRLFLAELVPPSTGRLLYLDADALAVAPMDRLRTLTFGNCCAAAVGDYIMAFPDKMAARRLALGLGPDAPYFNSGVILFDWSDPRAPQALRDALHTVLRSPDNLHAVDQDALNAALEGKWLRLDPRWNTQTGFMRDIRDPAIMHFTGRRKPWQSRSSWEHRQFSRLYADWLAGTNWELSPDMPASLRRVQSLLLHVGKRLEGLRKARKVGVYLRNNRIS